MRRLRQRLFQANIFVATLPLLPFAALAKTETGANVFRLAVYTLAYYMRWLAAWALVFWLAPTLLAGTSEGLQTLFQALAASIVAIFVLLLGSVFVIAQQALAAYGTRAPLMLIGDPQAQTMVLRPLLVVVAALALSGQVPASGDAPSEAVTAAATAITIATCVLFFSSAALLARMLAVYTAPVNFGMVVLKNVEDDLKAGWTGQAVFKVPLLGEMLRTSLRRGDSPAVRAALEALRNFQGAYIRAATVNPAARTHTYDSGESEHGWLGESLHFALTTAGEEALKQSATEGDTNEIAVTLEICAEAAITANHDDEALTLISGLTELSVSAHQVSSGGINYYGKAGEALAVVERHAEAKGKTEVAASALAGWLLAMSYPQYHFQQPQHPLWESGIEDLGPTPPWDEAEVLIRSDEWRRRWANKMYLGPDPLLENLHKARKEHSRRP